MNCPWKDEEIQRFAEGTLAPEARQALAGHLEGCAGCRERIAEAQRLEAMLQAGITPVAAPVTLAARVAGAVAAERKRRPARLPFWGRRLTLVAAALALVLGLSGLSYAIAPAAVTALVQRALLMIPGLGIKDVDESALVASGPVAVQAGGATLTIEALFSDGKSTTVKYRVTGLPGGKAGWETQHQGDHLPTLRDDAGRDYAVQTGVNSVGGSPEETVLQGEFAFEPLPAETRSVDLTVPLAYLLPPALIPAEGAQEWVAHIPLARPAESGLSAATPQEAAATAQGITLQVAASNPGPEQTVLLLQGQAPGQARLLGLGRMGDDPAQAVTLADNLGRRYELAPQDKAYWLNSGGFQRDLYFGPLGPGAAQLTLRIAAVQVAEPGTANVSVPLAGRQVGDTWALDRTIDLGGHPVLVKSATLGQDEGGLWLYVDVELGDTVDGRTLAQFQVRGDHDGSSMASMGKGHGAQMDRFGVPVQPGRQEINIQLSAPVVVVEGPWEITFPVHR